MNILMICEVLILYVALSLLQLGAYAAHSDIQRQMSHSVCHI